MVATVPVMSRVKMKVLVASSSGINVVAVNVSIQIEKLITAIIPSNNHFIVFIVKFEQELPIPKMSYYCRYYS